MAKRSQRLCQASWQSTLLGYVASPHSPRNASQHRIRHAEVRQIRARLRIHGASLEQSVSSDATHSYPQEQVGGDMNCPAGSVMDSMRERKKEKEREREKGETKRERD